MSGKSPVTILYTTESVEIPAKNGLALVTNARGFITVLSDGTNTYFAKSDSTGRAITVGAGTAGSPIGGVVSIQGVSGGQTVPISAPSAIPVTTTQLPATLLSGRLDINNGAWLGSVAPTVGQKTMANSLPVVIASDQTAVTVSGTVTASAANIALNGSAAPGSSAQIGGSDGTNLQAVRVHDLDTSAGFEYDLGVSIRLPGSGGSVAGGTSGNPIRVDPVGTTAQPISGTVTATQGNAGSHVQRWMVGLSDGSAFISPATDRITAASPFSHRLSDGSAFYNGTKDSQLPAVLVGGRLDTNNGAWLGSTAPTVGQKTMVASIPVAIASDQSSLTANQGTAALAAGAWPIKITDATNTSQILNSTPVGTEYGLVVRPIGGATNSTFGVAFPSTGIAAGFYNGATLEAARVFDADSGAGTQFVLGAQLRRSASGGSQELIGQTSMSNSLPVTIASDQNSLLVTATGNVASGISDSGNPLKIGGPGYITNPTAVGDGQRVNAFFDKNGRIVNSPFGPRSRIVTQTTAITNSTAETTVLAAGGAGVFRDIIAVIFSSTSGANIRVDFRDSTGGSVRWSIYASAAYSATDFYNLNVPFPQAVSANNWTAQCSASVNDIRITVIAVETN